MGMFRRKVPLHYIAVHPDNIAKKDWIILLEAGTIVGPSPERLRVARSTLERKTVKKYNVFLRAEHFLVVEGYDPRIHVVYFCPQLYRYDADKKLVALQGEEIGRLIAQALEGRLDPAAVDRGEDLRVALHVERVLRLNVASDRVADPLRFARFAPRIPRRWSQSPFVAQLAPPSGLGAGAAPHAKPGPESAPVDAQG